MPRPLADLYLDVADSGMALAPDGKTLAYVGRQGERSFLELRRVGERGARRLRGMIGAKSPFFSPDGRYLGFLASGKLKRFRLDSYEVEVIADVGDGDAACFREDGSVLLGSSAGLFRISREGQKEELLRAPARSPVEIHGSEWVVFEVGDEDGARLEVFSLASRTRRTLVPRASLPRFLPPGYLLFLRDSAIRACRLDLAKAELVGEPVVMVPDVDWFDVAANGTLAFRRTGGLRPALRIVLHWDEELKRRVPESKRRAQR
jgi:serine/threonine-protein kinase